MPRLADTNLTQKELHRSCSFSQAISASMHNPTSALVGALHSRWILSLAMWSMSLIHLHHGWQKTKACRSLTWSHATSASRHRSTSAPTRVLHAGAFWL